MHPFAVLGDPVRRRLVETLVTGERSAGELVELIGGEFGISQSAISQQLQVLRENGFASVRAQGKRRIYAIDPEPLRTVSAWIAYYSSFWSGALDDLATEVEVGKAERAQSGKPAN